MIMIGLLLWAQVVPDSLMARADAANLSYTQCLFAASREAHGAGQSVAAFERRLATRCLAEERELASASARIFTLRGDPAGMAKANQLTREARRGMVENYRRIPEFEPQIEELAKICRERPEACR